MFRGLPRLTGPLMLAAVWSSGCTKDSNPTDTGPTNVAVTGVTVTGPSSLIVEETAQLQAAVQPNGVSQSVTWSSNNEKLATVSSTGLVTALHTPAAVVPFYGPVTITATSTADPDISGSIDLNIECPTPREVTSNVDDDTTWEDWVHDGTCLDYVVRTNITLTQAMLTVEDSVNVGFDQGLYLRVQGDGGALTAVGNPDFASGVWLFTGTQDYPKARIFDSDSSKATRGWWGGVYFDHASNPANHLERGHIYYAGDADFGSSIQPAATMIDGNSIVTMKEVDNSWSSGYGLFIQAGAVMPECANNPATHNTLGPAYVDASVAHYAACGHGYLLGNGPEDQYFDFASDWVMVRPGEVSGDVEWDAITTHFDFDNTVRNPSQPGGYRILPGGDLKVMGHLTLKEGAHIEFSQGEEMVVSGSLNADGAYFDRIVFSGIEKQRGYWRGLRFTDTSDPKNFLDFVTVEYGGGPGGSGSIPDADLMITHATTAQRSKVEMTNSVLSESAGYGLWIRGEDEVTNFSQDTLTANALGPALLSPPAVDGLLDDGVYSGNDVDFVSVTNGGGINNIVKNATWRDLGVPYRIVTGAPNELDVEQGALLTIQPGVEMRFGSGMGFSVTQGSFLAVMGTADKPVTLRGDDAQWRGIQLHDSNGYFDHAEIDDAGSAVWSGAQQPGAVTLTASTGGVSKATFTADVINNGAPYGTVFTLAGSTFGSGCLGPVFIPSPDMLSDHCNPNGVVQPPAGVPGRR